MELHDVQLERQFLAAAFTRPEVLREIDLPCDALFNATLRRIYEVLLEAVYDGEAEGQDLVLLKRKWEEHGYDLADYLAEVGQLAFPAFDLRSWKMARHYAKQIRAMAMQRRMASIHAQWEAQQGRVTPDALELWRHDEITKARDYLRPDEEQLDALAIFRELTGPRRQSERVTMFPEIDRIIGDLEFGSVLTILARPGVGKTMLATNVIARHLEFGEYGVMFASLEMPAKSAMRRIARSYLGWSDYQVREEILSTAAAAFRQRCTDRLLLSWKPNATCDAIKSDVVRWERAHEVKIRYVLIDYLQYMQASRGLSLYERTADLTRRVKEMAKALDLTVILLSQVKRTARGETESQFRPPTMDDARDSGTIEENADSMIGLWRDRERDEDLHVKSLKVREGAHPGLKCLLRFDWSTSRLISPDDERVWVAGLDPSERTA